jgi:hypothetical protein
VRDRDRLLVGWCSFDPWLVKLLAGVCPWWFPVVLVDGTVDMSSKVRWDINVSAESVLISCLLKWR